MTFIFAISFILMFSNILAHTFEDCGSTNFITQSLLISPDPAIAGKAVSVTLVGDLIDTLSYPEIIDTTIVYGNIPYTMTDNFCELDIDSCTKINDITLTKTMDLPKITMAGTYETKLVMYNSNKSIAGCIKADVTVKK